MGQARFIARPVVVDGRKRGDLRARLGGGYLYQAAGAPLPRPCAPQKKIAKGDTAAAHVEAARKARAAGMALSVIALLGIAGERSDEHARATAKLVTDMDPELFAALTVTIVPGTRLAQLHAKGRFDVPAVPDLLRELRTMIDLARPTDATFRTNHASNYLPLAGRLPRDRARIVAAIDAALEGKVRLRAERTRGL